MCVSRFVCVGEYVCECKLSSQHSGIRKEKKGDCMRVVWVPGTGVGGDCQGEVIRVSITQPEAGAKAGWAPGV